MIRIWLRAAFAALIICWFASIANAQDGVAPAKAEIVDYGIYVGRVVSTEMVPSDLGPVPFNHMDAIRYITHTDQVEARYCNRFGVTFKVDAALAADPGAQFFIETLHPRFTGPDGRTSTREVFETYPEDGVSFAGFSFDHDFELEPGEWTFVLKGNGAELARKSFTVTKTDGGSKSECNVTS